MFAPIFVGGQAFAEGEGAAHPGFLPQAFRGFITQDRIVLALISILVCLSLVALVHHRMRLRRRALRQQISGLSNGARFRLVDAVVHAAWRRRKLDDVRLRRALEIARDATDMDYDLSHMRELALRADRLILPLNFRWMRANLDRTEKLVIFNAATSVIVASGRLTRADQRFLGNLSRGLGLKRSDLRDLARLVKS
ncbi:MAG: hypothetical protein AAF366_20525 [Pseudomonadota bacterium]